MAKAPPERPPPIPCRAAAEPPLCLSSFCSYWYFCLMCSFSLMIWSSLLLVDWLRFSSSFSLLRKFETILLRDIFV